ncbi:MAG TPA: non-lysosomal glucosylceramidase [Herpetosiphonaceae bacterium]
MTLVSDISPATADELGIPAAAWSRPLGLPFPEAGVAAPVDHPLIDDGPFQGLPLGGMGSGSIGRTFRGDFARWHLEIGRHRYETAWANQWSVFVEQGGTRSARVLCTAAPDDVLRDWNWGYPVGAGSYHALFPRAWFVYDSPELPVRLSQEQFSPVIAKNYRESSLPVAVFEWRLENPTDAPLRVGLMLSWENFLSGDGPVTHATRESADCVGVEMRRGLPAAKAGAGSLAILAPRLPGVTISHRACWTIDESGAEIWQDFAADGALEPWAGEQPAGGRTAAAVAVTVDLAPGQVLALPVTLAWDVPITAFPGGGAWYKRHTRFWGTSGARAWELAEHAAQNYGGWRSQIEAWQQPILDDPARPAWYKTALFNELYYLIDGGTIWVERLVDENSATLSAPPSDVGLFSYLECYDYPFYGTLDVAFYSSWAQTLLWPELERQEIRQFLPTVAEEDLTIVQIVATKAMAERKLAGALPHDQGAPHEDPLLRTNAYNYQNINEWKDLNLKYVLRVYRDFVLLDDRALLEQAWPTVVQAIDYVRPFDSDGDGLLDHHGADQTYDTWEMEGASAYTATLLIAALEAASAMARELGAAQGAPAELASYGPWLEQARASLESKLWAGTYYLYNAGDTPYRDSIMADQLAGQWYAGALGLPAVAPAERVRQALRTVFEYNVMRFVDGTMGAVNGMRPDGQVDNANLQSHEVWTGTTYALAALMLQEGLDAEAWRTAWGVYNVTYVTKGFWFRTPEAWNEDGTFRASMYMRPQSIWAIEHALSLRAAR